MIVVSAGMPRGGSGWHFNLINDLLVLAGHDESRALRDEFGLENVMRFYNCNVAELGWGTWRHLMRPHLAGRTFVVKTHWPPSAGLRVMMAARVAKAVYIYRDPRDAALSAYEQSAKQKARGIHDSVFARLDTIDKAIDEAAKWVEVAEAWRTFRGALLVRYETLQEDFPGELERLIAYLGVSLRAEQVQTLLAQYERPAAARQVKGGHLEKGVIGRHSSTFTPEQQARCLREFAPYMQNLGYS